MKKSLLIVVAVLSAFSILALEYFSETSETLKEDTVASQCSVPSNEALNVTERNPNFHYDIGSRFSNTITLEALLEAKIVDDLIAADAMNYVESMWEVEFKVLSNKKDKIEKGDDRVLTADQLDIIQSLDYNTDCNIKAFCTLKDSESGRITEGYFDDYFTVTPEIEASYDGGKDAIIDYLVSKSSELVEQVDQKYLKDGKVRFVITKKGTIGNVSLESSCGYIHIDAALIGLIEEMPKNWTPAENANGEKVDQELVFFYGLVGC